MTRKLTVKCPVCAAILSTKRLGEVPRHAAGRTYSRKTRCSGSGSVVVAKR